jgi:hypothetical protein
MPRALYVFLNQDGIVAEGFERFALSGRQGFLERGERGCGNGAHALSTAAVDSLDQNGETCAGSRTIRRGEKRNTYPRGLFEEELRSLVVSVVSRDARHARRCQSSTGSKNTHDRRYLP